MPPTKRGAPLAERSQENAASLPAKALRPAVPLQRGGGRNTNPPTASAPAPRAAAAAALEASAASSALSAAMSDHSASAGAGGGGGAAAAACSSSSSSSASASSSSSSAAAAAAAPSLFAAVAAVFDRAGDAREDFRSNYSAILERKIPKKLFTQDYKVSARRAPRRAPALP
jgi:hypothetical protein